MNPQERGVLHPIRAPRINGRAVADPEQALAQCRVAIDQGLHLASTAIGEGDVAAALSHAEQATYRLRSYVGVCRGIARAL